jgi:hypothetical protein
LKLPISQQHTNALQPPSNSTNFSYGFGVSSPDLSQDPYLSNPYVHRSSTGGGGGTAYGELLKPPSSSCLLAGGGGGNATLKRGRLRASGTSLNSVSGFGVGSRGKLVECPTVPVRSRTTAVSLSTSNMAIVSPSSKMTDV